MGSGPYIRSPPSSETSRLFVMSGTRLVIARSTSRCRCGETAPSTIAMSASGGAPAIASNAWSMWLASRPSRSWSVKPSWRAGACTPSPLRRGSLIRQIQHVVYARGRWQHLLDHLQALGTQLGRDGAGARRVALGAAQRGDQAGPDGVAHGHEHDRDRARGLLRGEGGRRVSGHDDVRLEPYQFGRELRKPLGLAIVVAPLDLDRLAFDVAEIAQCRPGSPWCPELLAEPPR